MLKNRLLATIICSAVLFSCNDSKDSAVQEENYQLIFPSEASFQLRFVPKNWIEKGIWQNSDSSLVKGNAQEEWKVILEEVLSTSPNIKSILSDLTELEPDLSKNWIFSLEFSSKKQFACLYLSAGKTSNIKDFLISKGINKEEKYGDIQYFKVDNSDQQHNYILADKSHILIYTELGEESKADKSVDLLFHQTSSPSTRLDSLFGKKRNDIDMRIIGNDELAKKIPVSIIRDVVKEFKGTLSLNLKPERIALELVPENINFITRDVFKPISLIQEGEATAQFNSDLKQLKSILEKYQYLDDIEYELRKLGLTYAQIQNMINGQIQISYLGQKITKQMSTSYEYDEEFNQVEKKTVSNALGYDVAMIMGYNRASQLKDYLVGRKMLVPVGKGVYEPILGSKTKFEFKVDKLQSLNVQGNNTSKKKLLFGLNNSSLLNQLGVKRSVVELLDLKKGQLIIGENDEIICDILFQKGDYAYIKRIKNILEGQKAE